ncbi:MAG TPA: DNA-3-methyladenine glycosylase [Planctomycetaceae bacterium]|nr:DNA-3-methyladenine glycosylase [Planctomycetaceae bacterium]
MAFEPAEIRKAVRELSKNDLVLANVVKQVGPFSLIADPGGYDVLVRSILSQQISTAAARTIRGRLQSLLPARKISAKEFDRLTDEQLQSAGISRQKLTYLRHLTSCTLDGTINFRRIAKQSDEEAIAQLIQVKGIGRWTAQMYLMFSLGRMDVFAPDDLGLRNAMCRLYELPESSRRGDLDEFAEQWRPYRTVASWYLWRSLEQ